MSTTRRHPTQLMLHSTSGRRGPSPRPWRSFRSRSSSLSPRPASRSSDSIRPTRKVVDEYRERLGFPGQYPFTRGVQPTMYRGRFWTMRQYAGFATAEESNRRYRYLLEQGTTGLSVAFDLPTQIGYDSDDGMATGEVGKVGRGHRLARRHGDAVPRDSARQGLDEHDDQFDGRHSAGDVHRRRRESRACSRSSSMAPFKTTFSRSTSRAARTAFRRSPRCG